MKFIDNPKKNELIKERYEGGIKNVKYLEQDDIQIVILKNLKLIIMSLIFLLIIIIKI